MNEEPTRRERREKQKQEREKHHHTQRLNADKRRRNKKIINYGIIALVVIGAMYGAFILLKPDNTPGEYDTFAKCLTQKGVMMYGTDWCPHCQAQKKAFGNSFRYVTFINCDTSKAACDAAGVKGYPTWTFPQNDPVSGTQELSALAELSGCTM